MENELAKGQFSIDRIFGCIRDGARAWGEWELFDCLIVNRSDWECHGKGMNVVRQILRRFGRMTGTRTCFTVDYFIAATLSIVPDPLKTAIEKLQIILFRVSK